MKSGDIEIDQNVVGESADFEFVFIYRIYIPCIYVLNKIDQISIEVRILFY